ncbi:MAG: Ig-like domain-containing protein, partial [Candidatus Ozemobacteraceae bacterium]
ATINTTTCSMTGPGGVTVPGTVTFLGQTANFTPETNLAFNATYTFTIATGAKDLSGNALAASYTWSFTTGAAPDTTPPTVTSTDPASSAANIAVGKQLVATFSESMDASTITNTSFTLAGPGGTPTSGTVTYVGKIAKFVPESLLAFNATYTATIATGAKDLAGNKLATKYEWTFTTVAAPAVTSTDPASGATEVALNKKIATTFSKGMDPSTITNTTFTVTGPGGTSASGTVTYSGLVATFTPTSLLALNATYTVTIATGAKDLAGNALTAKYTWTFRTGAAPTVLSVYPASNTQNIGVKETIGGTFSKAMDPSTISSSTFMVTKVDGTPVLGSVTYNLITRIASFTPSTDLAEVTTYTATIATGAKDLSGNALATATVWTFRTGQAAPNIGRASSFVMMATAGIDGVVGSNINGDVGVSPGARTTITLAPIDVKSPYNIYAGQDAAIVNAQTDMVAAYDSTTKGNKHTEVVQVAATDLGGKTFYPGLYLAPTSFDITLGDLTLDAQGNPNAVFIFQMESTLTVATDRKIILAGGAKAGNVYWQVGSSATLNTTSVFKGNIMANVTITVNAGSVVEGRLLAAVGTAGAGAVTFNQSTITLPLP